jgi:DNA-binding CsgD family transcriptional regulator
MTKLNYDDAEKAWNEIARYQNKEMELSFKLKIQKRLLDIFQVGDYYYYIFNPATVQFEFVSENITSTFKIDDINDFTVQYIFDNMHPDDMTRFIAYEQKVTDFFNNLPPDKTLKYKVSYDFRLRNGEGNYEWIQHQATTIQSDDQGAVLRVLGIHTIISHIKTSDQPAGLSFIGLEDEPSFYNVEVASYYSSAKEILSSREKEILKLIIDGKTSEEIALILFISKHTVNSHRKNILRKSNCKTNSELIVKAITDGLI